MKSKRWVFPLVLVLVVLVLPAFIAWNFILAPVLETNARFKALIGKPESDAVRLLGEPTFRVTGELAKRKGIDYPWRDKGYQPVPDRPVHKEVLLYERSDRSVDPRSFAIYIFVAEDNRVEAVEFAGTS
jgi:hypothetical protein